MLAQIAQDLLVAAGVGDDQYAGVVLGGGADHGWSADVDVLDRHLIADVRPGDRLLEGVEVHADEVDRLDAVLLKRRQVLGIVPVRQNPRVDVWVQGLDPPVHDLRKARHF